MPENERLGIAAEYLATQVAGKKADAILPTLVPTAAWLAGAVQSAVRSTLRKVALATRRGVAGKAGAGGTTSEEER